MRIKDRESSLFSFLTFDYFPVSVILSRFCSEALVSLVVVDMDLKPTEDGVVCFSIFRLLSPGKLDEVDDLVYSFGMTRGLVLTFWFVTGSTVSVSRFLKGLVHSSSVS